MLAAAAWATAQSAATLLRVLAAEGFRVTDPPEDGDVLFARLRSTANAAQSEAEPEEAYSFADYSAFFAALPLAVQQAIVARCGAAEADPLFRPGRLDCGKFVIPGFRAGNIAIVVPPPRHRGEGMPVPSHSRLAAFAWLAEDFRAEAVRFLAGTAAEAAGPDAALTWLSPVRGIRYGLSPELEWLVDEC